MIRDRRMLELILLVAVLFLIGRLKGQLGNIDKEERDEEAIKHFLQRIRPNMVNNAQKADEIKEVAPVMEPVAPSTAEDLLQYVLDNDHKLAEELAEVAIKLQASNFQADRFLSGSKKAYGLVVEAYAKGNLEDIKDMLSPKILQDFHGKVDARLAAKHKLNNSIIAIQEAKIKSITLLKTKVKLNVQFISEQINFVEDEQQQVIKGSKTEIVKLVDVWAFEKELKSTDSRWTIVALQEGNKTE